MASNLVCREVFTGQWDARRMCVIRLGFHCIIKSGKIPQWWAGVWSFSDCVHPAVLQCSDLRAVPLWGHPGGYQHLWALFGLLPGHQCYWVLRCLLQHLHQLGESASNIFISLVSQPPTSSSAWWVSSQHLHQLGNSGSNIFISLVSQFPTSSSAWWVSSHIFISLVSQPQKSSSAWWVSSQHLHQRGESVPNILISLVSQLASFPGCPAACGFPYDHGGLSNMFRHMSACVMASFGLALSLSLLCVCVSVLWYSTICNIMCCNIVCTCTHAHACTQTCTHTHTHTHTHTLKKWTFWNWTMSWFTALLKPDMLKVDMLKLNLLMVYRLAETRHVESGHVETEPSYGLQTVWNQTCWKWPCWNWTFSWFTDCLKPDMLKVDSSRFKTILFSDRGSNAVASIPESHDEVRTAHCHDLWLC